MDRRSVQNKVILCLNYEVGFNLSKLRKNSYIIAKIKVKIVSFTLRATIIAGSTFLVSCLRFPFSNQINFLAAVNYFYNLKVTGKPMEKCDTRRSRYILIAELVHHYLRGQKYQ